MCERTLVRLSFYAPIERAGDLAKAAQDILCQQGCESFAASYEPPLPDYASGISAEEAAYRRIHGPPLPAGEESV